MSKMTVTERKELKTVLSNEFKLMRNEVDVRIQALAGEAERTVRAEYAIKLKEAEKIGASLRKIAEDAKTKLMVAAEKHTAAGFRPMNQYNWPDKMYRDISVEVPTAWTVHGLEEAVAEARKEVTSKTAAIRLELQRQEHDRAKELAVSALSSEEATTFFNDMPSLETLLPTAISATAAKAAISAKAGAR